MDYHEPTPETSNAGDSSRIHPVGHPTGNHQATGRQRIVVSVHETALGIRKARPLKSETLTRYELVSNDSHMNVLLDNDTLKEGTLLTLKDIEGCWLVVRRHETLQRAEIKRGWNNNI